MIFGSCGSREFEELKDEEKHANCRLLLQRET
jgi:hypothetical protein